MEWLLPIPDREGIRQWDAYTIQNEPIASVDLMERAGRRAASWIIHALEGGWVPWGTVVRTPYDWESGGGFHRWFKRFRPIEGRFRGKVVVVAGEGNNGGDAYVIARILKQNGYWVVVYRVVRRGEGSPDNEVNRERYLASGGEERTIVEGQGIEMELSREDVVIEGLVGSGFRGALRGLAGEVVEMLNRSEVACRIAIDVPAGLPGDSDPEGVVFRADWTICFEVPRRSFFFPVGGEYVGRWTAVSIDLHSAFRERLMASVSWYLLTPEWFRYVVRRDRSVFAHKGRFGHVLLVVGSLGKGGAGLLSAKSALYTGVGLVSVAYPQVLHSALHMWCPDVMGVVSGTTCWEVGIQDLGRYSAVGVGPGIGFEQITGSAFERLLRSIGEGYRGWVVLDADAITWLAWNRGWLAWLPANRSVLTPHPGECERLTGVKGVYLRDAEVLEQFAKEHLVWLYLKRAYTLLFSPDGRVYVNPTGNPGMAVGGMGDVFLGIVTGLVGTGEWLPEEALCIAPYWHGLAGDYAVWELGVGVRSLTASRVIECLPEVLGRENVQGDGW